MDKSKRRENTKRERANKRQLVRDVMTGVDNFTAYKRSGGTSDNRAVANNKVCLVLQEYAEGRLGELKIPEADVFAAHMGMLTAERVHYYVVGGELVERRTPDWNARGKGVDMAYKLNGSYAAEKVSHSGTVGFVDLLKIAQEEAAKIDGQ